MDISPACAATASATLQVARFIIGTQEWHKMADRPELNKADRKCRGNLASSSTEHHS
jgi:hypothetical protein